jgi:DHA2 family multidrug resistance protein
MREATNEPFAREITQLAAAGGPNHRRDTILFLMMGIFPMIMSTTSINVAIPDIKGYFHATHLEVQVLSSAFLAAMTAALLLSGGVIGKLGVRRAFRLLVGGFMLSSLVAALLPPEGLVWLAVVRIAQGFLTGTAQALAMLVIISHYPASLRGRAISLYGLGITLSPILGPFVGGVLTSWLGWQGLFVFSLPFCAWAWLSASARLPLGAPADLPRSLRWLPALWLCTFVSGLTGAFLLWLRQPAWGAGFALLAVLGLLFFCLDQLRHRQQQVLNFSLLRLPGVLAASVISFTYGFGLFGTTYLLPVYLQDLGGWASWEAGLALLPGGMVLGLMLYLGGMMTDRYSMRATLLIGLVACIVSNAAFLVLLQPVHLGWFIAITLLGRVGLGLTIPSLNAGVTQVAPEEFASTATVIVNFFRSLGGSVGVGAVGLLLEFGARSDQDASLAKVLAYQTTFLALTLSFVPAVLAWFWMRPGPLPVKTSP